MLADVSVPLVGVAADGVTGAKGRWAGCKFAVVCCFGTTFCFGGVAAKLTIASEMPAVHNRTATKLRRLIKADLVEDFFFIEEWRSYCIFRGITPGIPVKSKHSKLSLYCWEKEFETTPSFRPYPTGSPGQFLIEAIPAGPVSGKSMSAAARSQGSVPSACCRAAMTSFESMRPLRSSSSRKLAMVIG